MSTATITPGPLRLAEPCAAEDYSKAISEVAATQQSVIVQRNGADIAALIPIEQYDILRDALAAIECEKLAARINWDRVLKNGKPPQEWFDRDEPKPF